MKWHMDGVEQMEPAAPVSVDFWSILLPVVVGGLIASLTGLLGPVITHAVQERSAAKKRNRERFDEMFRALYEHKNWLSREMDRRVYLGTADGDVPSPLSRVFVIASLDFPGLLPILKAFELSVIKYELWMRQAAQRRASGEISTLNDGFEEAYKPYLDALSRLEAAFQDHALKNL